MQIKEYKEHSSHQFSAHDGCADMLTSCIERLAKRIDFQESHNPKRWHIADLGSADGTNTMGTLQSAVHELRTFRGGETTPLHVTFEDHPSSDKDALEQVLNGCNDWFVQNDITRSILMKSFYKPLFEPESLDLMLSYICLHWMDTTDAPNGVADWKLLHRDSAELCDFTFINEATAPKPLTELWRRELANVHLARFFALRAMELRPGAEALVVVVGHPHQFVVPPDGKASPMTQAMQRCVEQGVLREQILRRTIVPYFLRTVEDIKEAFDLSSAMQKIETAGTDEACTGSFLELVDVRSYSTVTGGGQATLEGPFELFWSIHSGAVKSAGATQAELKCVKQETRRVFDETYDPQNGIPSTFLACVVRRRTRRSWRKH
jgi:hypothetical protein